jgi:phage gp36-like protein
MMIQFDKTPEQLAMEEVRRTALETAAQKIEQQGYLSETYQKALKTAARIVRSLKP